MVVACRRRGEMTCCKWTTRAEISASNDPSWPPPSSNTSSTNILTTTRRGPRPPRARGFIWPGSTSPSTWQVRFARAPGGGFRETAAAPDPAYVRCAVALPSPRVPILSSRVPSSGQVWFDHAVTANPDLSQAVFFF